MGGGFYAAGPRTVKKRPNGLFLAHRALVPQAHDIAVRVDELGAISPEILLWSMAEGNAARRPLGEDRIDIVDLEPQRGAVRAGSRLLLQEDREALAVLQGHSAAGGDLEFDLQAERGDVPVARPVEVAHREVEVVELHHDAKRLMKPPPSTRLPFAAS